MKNELINHTKILMLTHNDRVISNNGNQYHILRFINIGKNGAVFYARCMEGRLKGICCAIKVQYNLLPKRLKRFQREVDFLRQQTFSHFISYYDNGVITFMGNTYPFVVMPYFPFTLEDYAKSRFISVEKKLDYSCQLLMALIMLKSQNVIHRDIKPQNLLTDGHHIVLADFGLVKNIEELQTENDAEFLNASTSMPKYYRTPELVAVAKGECRKFCTESDVFQMGLVLAWLFTGVNPLQQTCNKLDDIALYDVKVTGSSGESIQKVISAMLAKDRCRRIDAATALNEMLRISTMIKNSSFPPSNMHIIKTL